MLKMGNFRARLRGASALPLAMFALAADGVSAAHAGDDALQVRYNFISSYGSSPQAGLIADKAGNLYGTTAGGCVYYGTVFKLAPDGTETVLHCFRKAGDGAYPYSSLIRDGKGNLYGTTTA